MTIPGLERVFRGDKPVYAALGDVLAEAIADGHLAPGEQLPTHRAMADRLGVTTATVTRAYLEAERRGLVRGEVGRGTFVRSTTEALGRFDFGREVRPGITDLALNLPPVGSPGEEQALFAEGLAALAARADVLRFLHYQPVHVLEQHREAGRVWLARCGVTASASEVVVTAGSQHGLYVALAAVTRPGEEVLTEALTYPGLKSAAEMLHLRLRAVAMDDEGILPEALEEAAKGGAKVVYLVPTLHNPTTGTMSLARRKVVSEILARLGLTLIEDDIHALLLSDKNRPRPLTALVPEHGIYIANTAKVLAPALRVSYLRAPLDLVERIVAVVQASVWMTSPLGAELATHWIQSGAADRLLALRRKEAAARQALATKALAGWSYRSHPAAYHGWLTIPEPWRTDAYVARLNERGVAVTAPEAFVVDRAVAPRAVRVCLGGAPDRRALAAALDVVRTTLEEGPRLQRAVV